MLHYSAEDFNGRFTLNRTRMSESNYVSMPRLVQVMSDSKKPNSAVQMMFAEMKVVQSVKPKWQNASVIGKTLD